VVIRVAVVIVAAAAVVMIVVVEVSSSSSSSNSSSGKLSFAYMQAGVFFSHKRVQFPCTNFLYCPCSFMIP
jgi:hypothetical protein